MRPDDWTIVRQIYADGIDSGDATFDTAPPDWGEWDRTHLNDPRLVAVNDEDSVLAWAAACSVSERCAYTGVVEVSIYVDRPHQGQGVGRRLLEAFLLETDALGIWTVQAGVFPENTASLALHERCGFRRVGVRERLGKLHGRWRDVILLERRSPAVN